MAPAAKSCPADKSVAGLFVFLVPGVLALLIISSTCQSRRTTGWLQTIQEQIRTSRLVPFVYAGWWLLRNTIDLVLPDLLPSIVAFVGMARRTYAGRGAAFDPSAPIELETMVTVNASSYLSFNDRGPHVLADTAYVPAGPMILQRAEPTTTNRNVRPEEVHVGEQPAQGALSRDSNQVAYHRSDSAPQPATSVWNAHVSAHPVAGQVDHVLNSQSPQPTEIIDGRPTHEPLHSEVLLRRRTFSTIEVPTPSKGRPGRYTNPPRRATFPRRRGSLLIENF